VNITFQQSENGTQLHLKSLYKPLVQRKISFKKPTTNSSHLNANKTQDVLLSNKAHQNLCEVFSTVAPPKKGLRFENSLELDDASLNEEEELTLQTGIELDYSLNETAPTAGSNEYELWMSKRLQF